MAGETDSSMSAASDPVGACVSCAMTLPIAADGMCMECLSSTLMGPQRTFKRVATLAAIVACLPLAVALTRSPSGEVSLQIGLILFRPGNLLAPMFGGLGLILGAVSMVLAFRGKGRRLVRVLVAAGIITMAALMLLVSGLGNG